MVAELASVAVTSGGHCSPHPPGSFLHKIHALHKFSYIHTGLTFPLLATTGVETSVYVPWIPAVQIGTQMHGECNQTSGRIQILSESDLGVRIDLLLDSADETSGGPYSLDLQIPSIITHVITPHKNLYYS